jgi:hypothetical protein
MLPIGYLGPHPGEGEPRKSMFTEDEARSLMTFWSIFRSPLMIGANLPASDAFTLSLLTNPEVLAVDQHSVNNHPIVASGREVTWVAKSADDPASVYVAVVNVTDAEQIFQHSWKELGLPTGIYQVRDLWKRRALDPAKQLGVSLPPHGSILYRILMVRK